MRKKVGSWLFTGVFIFMLVIVLLLQSNMTAALPDDYDDPIHFEQHSLNDDFGESDVHALDLDKDGDIDIVGSSYDEYSAVWWENDGNQNFTERTIANSISVSDIQAADLDSDNDIDVVGAVSNGSDNIVWWENDGNENFTQHVIVTYFFDAKDIHVANIDGDADLDIVGASSSADEITWWENDGNEQFIEHIIDSNFDYADAVYVEDVDGDGNMDVVGAAEFDNAICWWANDGNENFTKHTISSNFDGATGVHVTDLDDDGDMDILGAAWTDGFWWWENDGSQNFSGHSIDTYMSYDAQAVTARDMDGDGDKDIVGTHLTWYADQLIWWENDGNQNFEDHTVDSGFPGASVFVEDIDQDGDVDVLAGSYYSSGGAAWWESQPPYHYMMLPFIIYVPPPPLPTTIDATEDTMISKNYASGNFCNLADMLAGYDDYNDGKIVRSLMQFDVSNIPPATAITQATLNVRLYGSYDFPNKSRTVTTYRVGSPTSLCSTTWNNQPAIAEAYSSQSINHEDVGDWYAFDVTNLVIGWVNGSFDNNGVWLRGPEKSGGDSSYRSFFTMDTYSAPYLSLTYSGTTNTVEIVAPQSETDASLSWLYNAPGTTSSVNLCKDNAGINQRCLNVAP